LRLDGDQRRTRVSGAARLASARRSQHGEADAPESCGIIERMPDASALAGPPRQSIVPFATHALEIDG